MPQHTIEFKAVFPDTPSAAAAAKGLRHIAAGYSYDTNAYFKKQYQISEISQALLDCYNTELSRRKNTIKGVMDTREFEEPTDLIDLLTVTGALTLEITLCHDETGEEEEFKIDNHDLHPPASPGEAPKPVVVYGDLDTEALQKVVYRAIYTTDLDTISAIYDSGIDINYRFEDGKTALMKAASYKRKTQKSLALIRTLIDYGADVNAKSDYGSIAVFKALEAYNLPVIQLLVDAGARLHNGRHGGTEVIMDLFAWAVKGEGVIEKEKEYLEVLAFLKGQGESLESYFKQPLSLEYDGSRYNSLLRTIAEYDLLDLITYLAEEGVHLEKLAYILYRYSDKPCRAADFIREKGKGIIDAKIEEIDRIIAREAKVNEITKAAKKANLEKDYSRVIALLEPIHKSGELWTYDTGLLDKAREKLEEYQRKTLPESQAVHNFKVMLIRPAQGTMLSAAAHIDLVWGIKTAFDFHPVSIRAVDNSGWDMGLDGFDHLEALVYCRPPFNKGINSGFHFQIDTYGDLCIEKIETALSEALSTPAIYFKKFTVSCQGIEIRFKAAEPFPAGELPLFMETAAGRKLSALFEASTNEQPVVHLQSMPS